VSEPLMMPRHVEPRRWDVPAGSEGLAVGKRQVPVGQRTVSREDTTALGV
jgi:hypothetical protein